MCSWFDSCCCSTCAPVVAGGADPATKNRPPKTWPNPNHGLRGGWGLIVSVSPLGEAAKNGHADIVSRLLQGGADPNTHGMTFGPYGVLM